MVLAQLQNRLFEGTYVEVETITLTKAKTTRGELRINN